MDLFNSQNPQIRLTREEEMDRELPFLDLLFRRAIRNGPNQRSLTLSIHRKPTHNHKYLHYRSSHPLDLKRNGLRGHWLRARQLLKNDPIGLQRELRYLRETFTTAKMGTRGT